MQWRKEEEGKGGALPSLLIGGMVVWRRNWWMIILVVSVLAVVGWYRLPRGVAAVDETRLALDTFVQIKATGRNGRKAVDEAFAEIERLEELLDRFQPTSQVSRLNEQAGLAWVELDEDTRFLLEQGQHYGRLSQGAFDVTVGVLADLWGFGSDHNRVPSPAEIEAALDVTGYPLLAIEGNRAFVEKGVKVDLGGIAKGYTVDKAAAKLRQRGVKHAIINAGGDVYAIGSRPDGKPWRVGVTNPRQVEGMALAVYLQDQAIATSGDYQRFFIHEGERYHHILDPRTGYPARGLASVSVIAPSAMEADALATAVFVLGRGQGLALVDSLPGVEAVLITDAGEILVSKGLEGKIDIFLSDGGADEGRSQVSSQD